MVSQTCGSSLFAIEASELHSQLFQNSEIFLSDLPPSFFWRPTGRCKGGLQRLRGPLIRDWVYDRPPQKLTGSALGFFWALLGGGGGGQFRANLGPI